MAVEARLVLLRAPLPDLAVQVGVLVGLLQGLCRRGRLFRVLLVAGTQPHRSPGFREAGEAELFKTVRVDRSGVVDSLADSRPAVG